MISLFYNMTFFDKFFTAKSRNINEIENEHYLTIGSFSSSVFNFNKDQIRVVLFRECDKRGRKLLFDSNAVEKLPITSHIKSENSLHTEKCDKTQNPELLEFVEVTNSHGYKYKKPSNDVTLLGEMIFGSVAMVFKGGNTCKIHRLSSPKRVMFTNIIHASEHCHGRISSGHYLGTGSHTNSGVFCECSEETRTSSSDSKLYQQKQTCKHNVNTYPCVKHKYHQLKKCSNCEVNICSDCNKGSSQNSSNSQCSEKLNVNVESEESLFSEGKSAFEKVSGNCGRFSDYSELSLYCSDTVQNNCNCPSSDVQKDSDEYKKDISPYFSNLNYSLGSWKRRLMQSYFSSLKEIDCQDSDRPKSKTKTKLGMGLVVELNNDVDDELEKFLFNHSIIIETILKKLQSSIETACAKRESFVDLTHRAFINCQRSMYELITGEKYTQATWLSLIGKTKHEMESLIQNENFIQCQENVEDNKAQDALSVLKLKFLNDFCDLLVKFDTKDTNFFISTLLTAVLTHHLSWVTEIAESDVFLPQHKLRFALKTLHSYNPIWAQLNDLNGILGSPFKCARTVVTGPESSRNSIAAVVQILTYFIRCYNVIENLHDFDFEDITNINNNEESKIQDSTNVDCGVSSKCDILSEVVRTELNLCVGESKNTDNCVKVQVSGSGIPVTGQIDENHLHSRNIKQSIGSSHGMKKSKSCLFHLEKDDGTSYLNVHHAKMENVYLLDKNDENECHAGNNSLSINEPYKKTSHLLRVPSKAGLCHLEESFHRSEDFDATATFSIANNEGTGDYAEETEAKDGVLFVLGENEKLVNLKKLAAVEFESINLEKEQDSSTRLENISQSESKNSVPSTTKDSKNNRVLNEHNVITERSLTETCTILPDIKCEKFDDKESIISSFHELPLPKCSEKHLSKKRLDISSVLGSVNYWYNSEQIIQGVLEDRSKWENALRKDLKLYAHEHVLDSNVTEAICIIGDMNSWEVSLISSSNFSMDKRGLSSIRIGMSQLVADMLESLQHVCKINLPADFCLNHIEKKLHEIYTKSKCVAELLNTSEVSSIEYLTSRLDISVNDVPLLLSVATTHSPHISSRYGITYT